MKRILCILPLLMILSACSGEGDEAGDPPATHPAAPGEDIDRASIIKGATFTDLDGNEVSIDDFAGKVLVVDFWETWCGPCLQVFPAFQDLLDEYPDDFEVLAVTLGMMDGPDDAREFREDHDYTFQYLYDEHNLSDQLGIYSIPFKLYVDTDGELIKYEIGSRGRDGDYESARDVIEANAR